MVSCLCPSTSEFKALKERDVLSSLFGAQIYAYKHSSTMLFWTWYYYRFLTFTVLLHFFGTIYNAVTMLFDIYNGIAMFLQTFAMLLLFFFFFWTKTWTFAIAVVWTFTLVLPCFWTFIVVLLCYLQTFIMILPCFLDIFHRCNMEHLLCGYLFIYFETFTVVLLGGFKHFPWYYCFFCTNTKLHLDIYHVVILSLNIYHSIIQFFQTLIMILPGFFDIYIVISVVCGHLQ